MTSQTAMLDLANRLDNFTTGGALARAASRWPNREALIIGERRLTWTNLWDESVDMARGLAGLGIKAGSHVGLLMPNCIEYISLFHGIGLLGGVALTINARYKGEDLAHVVSFSDMEMLIIGGQAVPHLDFHKQLSGLFPSLKDWNGRDPLNLPEAPKLKRIVNVCDARATGWPTEKLIAEAAADVSHDEIFERAAAVDRESNCLMMFSSGTTALPKACLLSHKGLTRTGQALAERFRLTDRDKIWNPLPFFHMSTMLPLAACRSAGTALVSRLHFDAALGLDELEREKISVTYSSFPTMMSALVAQPDFAKRDLSSIRLIHCVGPTDLLRRYADLFPQAYLANAFGLTEAMGVCFYSDMADAPDVSLTTNGRPFTGVEVKIVDPESLTERPQGERGEIWIRGYVVFSGYYKDPEGTKKAIMPDGWLRSGDIGSVDSEGRVIYHGRLKDMIKIGGENVAAIEIESFLCTHPDIMIAQAIGVPDERLLEVAAAFVEVRPGSALTPEQVVEYCIGKIATYKIPRYVRFVKAEQWPMSATKIQKFQLLSDFKPEGRVDVRAMQATMKAKA